MDAAPRSPYIGLQPFTESQKALFFGREREVRLVGANALASKLTVVYGASGVGKSSLLWAGVLPDLRQRAGTAAVLFRDWQHADAPAQLRAAVCAAADRAAGRALGLDAGLPLDELLARVADALHGTTVLMLDQFEEYFRYHPTGGAADAFDAELARAVNRRDVDAGFVISIREDSLSQLDRYRARIPAVLANPLRIRHLSERAARDAIVKPLQACRALPGWQDLPLAQDPEDGLVSALLAQTRAGRVSLASAAGGRAAADEDEARVEAPYLQLVLARLWETECAKKSGRLHEQTLVDLGGAATIVRTHLDQVMARFSRDDRRLCAALFDRMVTPSGSKIACRVDDLRQWAPAGQDARVERVLAELAGPGARILRAIDPRPGEPPQFEIFHDVLALGVIDWRGRELALVESERQARLARRRRLFALGMLLVALVCGGFAGFSYVQWQDAQAQRRNADEALAAFDASRSLIASADPVAALANALGAVQRSSADRVTVSLRLALSRQRLRARADLPAGTPRVVAAAVADDGSELALLRADGSVDFRALRDLAALRRLPPGTLPGDGVVDAGRLLYRRQPDRLLLLRSGGVAAWPAPPPAGGRAGGARLRFDAAGRVALPIDGARSGAAFDPATGAAVALRGCGGEIVALTTVPALWTAEFIGGAERRLQLCDARAGRVLRKLALDLDSQAAGVPTTLFSADGSRLAMRDLVAEEVQVWDTASGRRTTLRDFTAAPHAPFFVSRGLLAVPAYDGRIDLWRLSALDRAGGGAGPARDERVVRLVGSTGTLLVAPLGTDGTHFVSVDSDGASVWQGIDELSPPLAEGEPVAHAVWGADGVVRAALRDGRVGRLGDDGRFVAEAPAPDAVLAVRPSPDGERVIVLGSARAVVWNLRRGERLGEVAADGALADAAWASYCCAFTLRQRDGRVTLHEWDGERPLPPRALAPQPQPGWLAPGGTDWLTRRGTRVPAAATGTPEVAAAGVPFDLPWPFAEDGRALVLRNGFFPALAAAGGGARQLEGHSGMTAAVGLSANGHWIVTGSDDWHAIIWDARDKVPPVRLTGHTQSIVSVAITRPKAAFVATTARDATVRVWEPYSGEQIARAALPGPDWRLLDFRDARVLVAGPAGGLRVLDCQPCWPADRLRALADGRLKVLRAAVAAVPASAPR